MKICFLDIDGVLNSADYMLHRKHLPRPTRHNIDALTVPRLNEVTSQTGARLVISSTWRLGKSVQWLADILGMHGVTGTVIDKTPSVLVLGGKYRAARGIEIQTWIDAQDVKPERFAIIDDDRDMAHLSDRLVKTTWELGMLDEHVERCVELLT